MFHPLLVNKKISPPSPIRHSKNGKDINTFILHVFISSILSTGIFLLCYLEPKACGLPYIVISLPLTRRRWFWLGGIYAMPIKQCKRRSPSDTPLPQNQTTSQEFKSNQIEWPHYVQFVPEKEQVPGVENPVSRQESPLSRDTTVPVG